MNDNNLPDSRIIFASGLTNIGCDQSGSTFQTLVMTPPSVESQDSNLVAPFDWNLLPFIHPQWLGNDAKCHAIYNHIKSILCQDSSIVCSQLYAMHESKLLMLSGVPTKTVYSHLKNMGFVCPESTFYDKYKAPK